MNKIIRICSILLVFLLLPAYISAAEELPSQRVYLINHRGYNTVAPENTLPAFELSKEMGYVRVETDVSFTKDGIPVLLHDETINRTARCEDGSPIGQEISINDITYEEALKYDFGIWKGEDYKGVRIPTFESFLLLCRDQGLYPYIELKENGDYRPEQIAGLTDLVRQYGMADQVTWISFSVQYLTWVKEQEPAARLGLLALFWITPDAFSNLIRIAQDLRMEQNEVFLDVNAQVLLMLSEGEDPFVPLCREAGIPLEVWTVDTQEEADSLDPYISGITTNCIR